MILQYYNTGEQTISLNSASILVGIIFCMLPIFISILPIIYLLCMYIHEYFNREKCTFIFLHQNKYCLRSFLLIVLFEIRNPFPKIWRKKPTKPTQWVYLVTLLHISCFVSECQQSSSTRIQQECSTTSTRAGLRTSIEKNVFCCHSQLNSIVVDKTSSKYISGIIHQYQEECYQHHQ